MQTYAATNYIYIWVFVVPSGRLTQTRRTNNRQLPHLCTKFLRNALLLLPEAAKNDILMVDFL